MRERPAKLPASLHHSSSSCHVNVTNVTNAINTTSSSLARVRKEEAKRASLLGISSHEENDTDSLLEEIEGSLLEEREASLLRCRAASRLFMSLHWFVKTLLLCVITITTIVITITAIVIRATVPWSLPSSSWRYFYAYHCRHSCQMRWLENHLNLINTYSVALENLDNYRGDYDERYDLLPSWWHGGFLHLIIFPF